MKAQLLFLFSLVLYLLFFDCVSAEEKFNAATVVATRGEVVAIDQTGVSRKLSVKSPIFEEDTIITGRRGKIQLLFKDSSIISLASKTEMKISEYRWDASEKSGALKTTVKEGTFRIMGGALAKFSPKTFTTETPSATIGIRGSSFTGTVTDNALAVVFQAGIGVDIFNNAGSVAITQPGYGTHVPGLNQAPLPPVKFSATDMAVINDALTGEVDDQDKEDPPDDGQETGANGEKNDSPEGDDDQTKDAEQGPNGEGPPEGEDVTDEPPSEDGKPGEEGSAEVEKPQEGEAPLDGDEQHDGTQNPAEGDPSPEGDQPPQSNELQPTLDGEQPPENTSSDGNQPPPDGSNPPPPEGNVPPPPVGSTPPPPEGSLPPPDGMMPPPSGDMAFVTDGGMLPPLDGGGDFLLGGDMTFMPNTDMTFLPPPPVPIDTFNAPPPPTDSFFDYQPELLTGDPSVKPTSLPTDGLTEYLGTFLGAETASGDTISGNLFMEVNWYSKKALGMMFETDPNQPGGSPVFFFGTVDPETMSLKDINAFGADGGDPSDTTDNVSALFGNIGSGNFLGANYELFDMTLTGTDYSLYVPGNPSEGSWNLAATTSRAVDHDPIDKEVPKNTSLWKGYVVGISENVQDPNLDRRMFVSDSSDYLSMTLDRGAGTITGDMKAKDMIVNQKALNVRVGEGGSGYVFDDHFAAIVGCTAGAGSACVDQNTDGTLDVSLNQYGNYLFTTNPDDKMANYATWGYWEASYKEADNDMYHTHIPYSMWIAGEATPAAYVNGLTFTASYVGKAKGSYVDTNGNAYSFKDGTSNININFSTDAVTGTISFPGVISFGGTAPNVHHAVLNIGGSSSFTDADFTANVISIDRYTDISNFTNHTTSANVLDGTVYGPTAESIGGSFYGRINPGSLEHYNGIFGGNR
nr:FecR domain-containing protein [Desulfobulbaceae bacterium]